MKGLPPGEYLAVALDYVDEDAWNDPEYLESSLFDIQHSRVSNSALARI